MLINFCLYRSKVPNEIIDQGAIKYNIESDADLVQLDDIIINILGDYIDTIPAIQKYGIAYIGKEELVGITITDEDNISLNEATFRDYMQRMVMPNLIINWKKTNITSGDKEPDKMKTETNEVDNK